MSIPLHRQTRCADCGADLDTDTADGCETCKIWLCAADKLAHDCDGWRSMTGAAQREAWEARQKAQEGKE